MNWQDFHQLRASLKRPLIMAHRGASALQPENTLSAFKQAIADGAHVLETDLRFSKDEEIVLLHDATLNRTVEASGRVNNYTLRELKQFRIKQPPEQQVHLEQIPTLRELLELVGHDIPLALELKDPLFEQPNYAQKLATLLAEFGVLAGCAVVSFYMSRVKLARQAAPGLAAGWITLLDARPNHPVEVLGPYWPLLLANPIYIRWAHKLGKIVCPLDPTPEPRLGLYLKLGVDVLLTDNPALTLREIERRIHNP